MKELGDKCRKSVIDQYQKQFNEEDLNGTFGKFC